MAGKKKDKYEGMIEEITEEEFNGKNSKKKASKKDKD